MNATPTTALAKPVLEVIEKGKQGFFDRLPKDIDRERLWLGLVTLVQKRTDIAECDPKSIIIAGYEAAEIGINLNPALGLGYVVPYKNIAQFQLGYRGMIQKGYEVGAMKLIFAEVVYENDSFRRVLAPVRTVEHVPPVGDRGKPIGAYAFVELRDGGIDFEYMTAEQIKRHRDHSKNANSLMWTTFWEEGWRKTPIRVLFKRIPLSSAGMEKFVEIIGNDTAKDYDFDVTPPPPPEIRRASESEKQAGTAETGPSGSLSTTVAAQAPAQASAKGRGRGKGTPDPESSSNSPAEAKAATPILADAGDVQKAWKRLYGAGWDAGGVKKFLEAKGFPAIKSVPKDQLEALLVEMESGGPAPW